MLVEDAEALPASGLLVVFHGYGQSADDALAEAVRIPGASSWTVASVQALHRFYSRKDERVIASWMTRQDREIAIADNVTYVDRAVAALESPQAPVFVGFSQGAAMAYRAALLGAHRAAGIVALAGDIPPELKTATPPRPWPPVLIGAGETDSWYTAAKSGDDAAFLASRHVPHDVVRFRGGHEWTDEFRAIAGRWIQRVIQAAAASRT